MTEPPSVRGEEILFVSRPMAAADFPIKQRPQHGWDQVRSTWTWYGTQLSPNLFSVGGFPGHLHLGTYHPVHSSGPLSTQPRPLSSLFFPQPTTRPPWAWQQLFEELQIPAAPPPTLFPPSVVNIQEIVLYTHTYSRNTHEHSYHHRCSLFTIAASGRNPSSRLFDQEATKAPLSPVVTVVSLCHLSPSAAGIFHVFFFFPFRAHCPSVHPSETIA